MPNEMFGYGFRNPIRVCRTSTLGRLVQVARAALVLAISLRHWRLLSSQPSAAAPLSAQRRCWRQAI